MLPPCVVTDVSDHNFEDWSYLFAVTAVAIWLTLQQSSMLVNVLCISWRPRMQTQAARAQARSHRVWFPYYAGWQIGICGDGAQELAGQGLHSVVPHHEILWGPFGVHGDRGVHVGMLLME
jgi:hypothetical protein